MFFTYSVRRCLAYFAAIFVLFPGCSGRNQEKSGQLRLAVVVVVDQMRADHLTRLAGLYTGGFARLLQQGAVFDNADHRHALTVTAAGHATISTGAFPGHSGIVSNDWFDRTSSKKVYCVEDSSVKVVGSPSGAGRSPHYLLRETVGDWLKKSSPTSKVFSMSRKDRAAVLMGGKHPDAAYWYNSTNGRFVTSDYYMPSVPIWVDSFNNAGAVSEYFAKGWQKSAPEEDYYLAREDRFAAEGDGIHTAFPHEFSQSGDKPTAKYFDEINATPFSDALLLQFAQSLVEHEHVGADAIPDLLFISCSAADAIGHAYGPLSQESEDLFLRLDHYLGTFFDFLDKKIGAENYTIVLSSDHGVLPLPEELQRRGYASHRIAADKLEKSIEKLTTEVARELKIKGNPLARPVNGIIFDQSVVTTSNVDAERLQNLMAERLKKLPEVADVYTYAELASGSTDGRPYFDLYKNSFHPDRSPDLMLRFNEFDLYGSSEHGTSHGAPYRYDSHVPIVFSGSGVKAGHHAAQAWTVDIAPTLASLLNIQIPDGVDGHSLIEQISQ